MKKYFIWVFVFLNMSLLHNSLAQPRDSLISLTPEIGDTIDLSERDYYGLYPNIQGFEYAMIYLRDDSVAVSRVTYLNENGIEKDTILTNRRFYIGNLRTYIRRIDEEKPGTLRQLDETTYSDELEKIIGDLSVVTISTKDSNKLNGWLFAVESDSLVLIPYRVIDENKAEPINERLILTSEEIQSVYIEGENKVGSSVVIGLLIGAAFGVAVGLSSGDDPPDEFFSMSAGEKAITAGLVLGLSGGLIGLIGGLISSTSDETIEINSAADLELLKEYIVQ